MGPGPEERCLWNNLRSSYTKVSIPPCPLRWHMPSLVPRPFLRGRGKTAPLFAHAWDIPYCQVYDARIRVIYNFPYRTNSSSLVHAYYTIGTSSTACLSQAGVYSYTYRETCVSSPVEHGTSLQKLTAAIISQERHIERLFRTQLHSRSCQCSRSCSKTLRHS